MAARGVLRQVSLQLKRTTPICLLAQHVSGIIESSQLPSQTTSASSYLANTSTPQSSTFTLCPTGPGIHCQSRSFTASRDGGLRQLAQADHSLAEGSQPIDRTPIEDFGSAVSGPEADSTPLPSASEPDTANESDTSASKPEAGSEQHAPPVPRPTENLTTRSLNSDLSGLMGRAAFADAIALYNAWRAHPTNEPSLLTYNMLLQSMMRLRKPATAMYEVFAEMKARGVAPDLVTYNCLMRRMFQLSDFTACDELMQG